MDSLPPLRNNRRYDQQSSSSARSIRTDPNREGESRAPAHESLDRIEEQEEEHLYEQVDELFDSQLDTQNDHPIFPLYRNIRDENSVDAYENIFYDHAVSLQIS